MGYVSRLITGSDFADWAAACISRDGLSNEAERRRATSAAYYGLFHTLVQAAAGLIAAGDSNVQAGLARTYEHRTMRQVCEEQLKEPSRRKGVGQILAHTHDKRLVEVATAFVSLQEARWRADYNLGVVISYPYALERVTLASQAVRSFVEVQGLPETKLFLTALLLGDRWRKRG